MDLSRRTTRDIARMICGDYPHDDSHFVYRSSKYLTEFFEDVDTDFEHDGSTRATWVNDRLREILAESDPWDKSPPEVFLRVIQRLMDRQDAFNEDSGRTGALAMLNQTLERDGLQAFYAQDGKCYLRLLSNSATFRPATNPHRPFSETDVHRRELLGKFLEEESEDALIEQVLLPLFRHLGFHRVTAVGHKDKNLEYGKDLWMRYTLPTQHILYFGIQAKREKLDASGAPNAKNVNMAEIYQQSLMMLGNEVFDAELNRRVLVDHAIIVAGGEITKSARNWLGGKLDAAKRSQILFLDRDDLLNLFTASDLPLPKRQA